MLQKWIFAYKLTCRSQGRRFSQGNFRPNELLTLFFPWGNCQYTRNCLYVYHFTGLQVRKSKNPYIFPLVSVCPQTLLSLPTGHSLKPIFIELDTHKCNVNPNTVNFSRTVELKFFPNVVEKATYSDYILLFQVSLSS